MIKKFLTSLMVLITIGAGTNYSSLGQVNKNETFIILNTSSSSWVHVKTTSGRHNGQKGYINKSYAFTYALPNLD